jgi:hypothetical protein
MVSRGEDEPAEEDADVEDGKYNRRAKTDGGRNLKDLRARKRRKLVYDVDFVNSQNPHTAPIEHDGDNFSLEFSTPSVRLFSLYYY